MVYLERHVAPVRCRRDGEIKHFVYYLCRPIEGKPRFGLQWGCQDKTPCQDCALCWFALRDAARQHLARRKD